MEEYGVVFSGGGAKGSYQIGVWKALQELGIPIAAITGTSIGALNGAMLVQGDYDLVQLAWTNFSVEQVIDNTDEDEWENQKIYNKHFTPFLILKNIITSERMEMTPLIEALKLYVDEDRIRNSTIDFGLVTFSVTDLKPLEIFKDNIPRGQFVDYLVASACFPAFKPIKIDNKKYIDGGFHDNVPIALMNKKGIKNLIVVDISGKGIPKSKPSEDSNTIYIKSSHDLGKTLEINPEKAEQNIELGYLDTMKTFNIVKGKKYYLVPDSLNVESEVKELNYINRKLIRNALGITKNTPLPVKKLITLKFFRTIENYMDSEEKTNVALSNAMAEITGEILSIDLKVAYTLDDLNDKIIDEYKEILKNTIYKKYIEEIEYISSKDGEKNVEKKIKLEIKNNAKFLLSYLTDENFENDETNKIRRLASVFNTKIVIGSLYLKTLFYNFKYKNSNIKATNF
ncbi:patatin-like phospholipase family protein [Sporanaerobacter acetigenes]|uniref:NTE family protein n=1 Tax=Sporanaerobacter acetigenes DSM 13106 TaxID=1123281 RepID=A0A1M5WPW0_9FIRM|nr:patatin-like phospholipase family protein [Sporanaerobacter acetigenes]SHH89053.1 NTE family protein [Sporanaerobacter acetigenes DSM 13106]